MRLLQFGFSGKLCYHQSVGATRHSVIGYQELPHDSVTCDVILMQSCRMFISISPGHPLFLFAHVFFGLGKTGPRGLVYYAD
jgi:hypothetical protein